MDRKYLRKKVQQLLKDANIPLVKNDVFTQRSVPTDIHNLPIILIYTKNETVERFDEAPKSYKRSIELIIEIPAVESDDELLADLMDDLANTVESIIENNEELETSLEFINLENVLITTESDGQSPVGSIRLIYDATYVQDVKDIDPNLDIFKKMYTTYKIKDNDSAQGADELEE